jgi:hypothetical protein
MKNPIILMAMAMASRDRSNWFMGNTTNFIRDGDFSEAIKMHDKNKRKKNKRQRGTASNKRKGKSR